MLALAFALVALAQAAPRDPEVYWTSYIDPETLPGEAEARAHDRDIVKRNALDLMILYDGKVVRHLVSDDRRPPSHIWLYNGSLTVKSDKLAVVRLETGKGGRNAIVKRDGTLFWTEGPAAASPDGRWIGVSGDWGDQMDDSAQNNYLRIFRWSDHREYVFHKACLGEEWLDATRFTADCGDPDHLTTATYVKGRWVLAWMDGGRKHTLDARTARQAQAEDAPSKKAKVSAKGTGRPVR